MGTSTSQKSAATPEWDQVRDLYRAGSRDAGAVSRAIASALGPATRTSMSGEGVTLCLESLLAGARAAGVDPGQRPLAGASSALTAASRVRLDAERRVAVGGLASRFTDLALDAVGTAALRALSGDSPIEQLGGYWREGRLHDLASVFLSDDVDRCFRYFVTRDLNEFVGTDAWPTVGEASWLTNAVGGYCREQLAQVPLAGHEALLQDVMSAPEAERLTVLRPSVVDVLDRGLAAIAGG